VRSIDLHFLSKRDKDLPFPLLKYYRSETEEGYYVHPSDCRYVSDENLSFDSTNGIIFVNSNSLSIESTLAHEWRHHWQYYRGMLKTELYSKYKQYINFNFKNDIVAYTINYYKIPYELDALRYECKLINDAYSLYTYNIVTGEKFKI
jgi:hypothetical protein